MLGAKTISYNQDEILGWIIKLYLNKDRFKLDPTYSTGQFYKHGILEPELKSDLHPQTDDCVKMDVREMVWEDESISSCVFDPPFLVGPGRLGKPGIMKTRFSAFHNISELYGLYTAALHEIYRVIMSNGILVFKCQDTVSSGKQHWSHIYIFEAAIEIGFKAEDLFILLAKTRLNNWKRQLHARKYHCYFWVFRK